MKKVNVRKLKKNVSDEVVSDEEDEGIEDMYDNKHNIYDNETEILMTDIMITDPTHNVRLYTNNYLEWRHNDILQWILSLMAILCNIKIN